MKRIKALLALLLAALNICLLFSSCSSPEKLKAAEIIAPKTADSSFHTHSSDTEVLAKNEYIEFIFDKKTFSVMVKDIKENYSWKTLSQKNAAASYAFGLTLYTSNGPYSLNTQDNSVAFGTAEYKKNANGITVSYKLSDKEETAKKSYEEITENDVYAAFSVTYSFSEQSMYVTARLEEALLTPSSFITDFEFLPCLGAAVDSLGDYFLVPDGSGAVMNLGKEDSYTESVQIKVYGDDPYMNCTTKSASATVPVFGVKRSNSAFAAIITEGDALATIKAERMTQNAHSAVSAGFTVTPLKADAASGTVYKGATYTGSISAAYKFLSGNSADYTSMAAAAREEFINNSVIKSTKLSEGSPIPFYLTVVGKSGKETLTTTQQTLDILGILKGKGINNIKLNYKGLLTGGLAQRDLYYARINNRLGGKGGIETLYEYTEKQGCSLILGTNIFSSAVSYPVNNQKTADGKTASFELKNAMSFNENLSDNLVSRIGKQASELGKSKQDRSVYDSTSAFTMKLRSLSTTGTAFSLFLEGDTTAYFDGICVSDAGRVLYSSAETDRESAKNIISEQLSSVSNFGSLNVENGNLYSLYNAELVSSLEFGTFYKESEAYEPVPFVPSVLHGYIHYTGKPIDAGDPLYRYEMLRYIEYGALPGYEWIYADKNIFCYSGYLLAERANEIADYYNDFIEIFDSLTDKTIVSHKKITKDSDGKAISGVYCTTYSDSTEIYVNYTGSIVSTPDNIAIGPYDYVAVKR